MDIYIEFGKRLAEVRKSRKLSQAQLAEKLDMPQSTYAQYEKAKRKIPLDLIVSLSNVLSISPTYLILGEEANCIEDFSEQESELIKKYRQLNVDGKVHIMKSIDFELSEQAQEAENKEERLA